ncbi:MAG: class I tRNA ligase family protein, partial [Chthoniobacterales bacterium]
FAPHISSELWEKIGAEGDITAQTWPEFDPALLAEDEVEIVFQVNGKVRDRARVPMDASRDELEHIALANERVREFVAGKEVVKVVAIQNKLVNVVVRP